MALGNPLFVISDLFDKNCSSSRTVLVKAQLPKASISVFSCYLWLSTIYSSIFKYLSSPINTLLIIRLLSFAFQLVLRNYIQLWASARSATKSYEGQYNSNHSHSRLDNKLALLSPPLFMVICQTHWNAIAVTFWWNKSKYASHKSWYCVPSLECTYLKLKVDLFSSDSGW